MGKRELGIGQRLLREGEWEWERESQFPILFPFPFPAAAVAQFPVPSSQFPKVRIGRSQKTAFLRALPYFKGSSQAARAIRTASLGISCLMSTGGLST